MLCWELNQICNFPGNSWVYPESPPSWTYLENLQICLSGHHHIRCTVMYPTPFLIISYLFMALRASQMPPLFAHSWANKGLWIELNWIKKGGIQVASTPSSLWMSKLFTVSSPQGWTEPSCGRKPFWSVVSEISFFWSQPRAHDHKCCHNGLIQCLPYCINLPVHITLPLPSTPELESNILKLVHFGQQWLPKPKGSFCDFPADNDGVRFGGADSHHRCFTPECKSLKCMLEVTNWWRQKNPNQHWKKLF